MRAASSSITLWKRPPHSHSPSARRCKKSRLSGASLWCQQRPHSHRKGSRSTSDLSLKRTRSSLSRSALTANLKQRNSYTNSLQLTQSKEFTSQYEKNISLSLNNQENYSSEPMKREAEETSRGPKESSGRLDANTPL